MFAFHSSIETMTNAVDEIYWDEDDDDDDGGSGEKSLPIRPNSWQSLSQSLAAAAKYS